MERIATDEFFRHFQDRQIEQVKAKRGFVHLHVKTDCTVSSSLITPTELARRVKNLGMHSVAVADRWTMAAIPEFCRQ